jgi:hypothetical protein
MSSSGREVGKAYVNFVRNSTEQLRQKVSDELWVLNFFEVIHFNLFELFEINFKYN